VLYHETSGDKHAPRPVLMVFEPGVIGAAALTPLGELLSPDSFVNQNAGAGKNWTNAHYTGAGH
jgi:hypothetical protein